MTTIPRLYYFAVLARVPSRMAPVEIAGSLRLQDAEALVADLYSAIDRVYARVERVSRPLTTDEATLYLATHYDRSEEHEEADRAIEQAWAYGRAWHWRDAARAIERAYRALGAAPPELENPGYAWHCGQHPIQLAEASRREVRP